MNPYPAPPFLIEKNIVLDKAKATGCYTDGFPACFIKTLIYGIIVCQAASIECLKESNYRFRFSPTPL